MAGYIGNQAQIRSGLSATIDELNIIDGVTATTAELNYNDTGAAVGTVVASKTVTADANKDVASLRNVTATGVATVGSVVVADGGNIGAASDTDSLAIASNGVVTFSQAPVFPDGSIAVADLDIDGGTDIGAALVDADLMIVDDGAGGTNRKATMTRLATYMGTKITSGSLVYIASSGAISSAATADFTQFDATKYDAYEFRMIDVLPATDGVIMTALTSSDTSSHSYDTGTNDYIRQGGASDTFNHGFLIGGNTVGNAANEGINFIVEVINPHTTAYTQVATMRGTHVTADGIPRSINGNYAVFQRQEAAQVNAIRFLFSAGNIASGEIVMYGIANGT